MGMTGLILNIYTPLNESYMWGMKEELRSA